jgi:hypothetical protein
LIKSVVLFLFFVSSIALAQEFPDKRLPVDENIWTSNEFVNAQRGRDIVIRRLPKDNSPCNNPDKCPPALIIDVEKGNTNVKGKLNADALYIGGEPIINQRGEWVGSTDNLRGPQGVQGPKGDQGEGCTITQDSIICGESVVTLETLRGPRGDRGPHGIQGPQGIRGPEGIQGPQGDIGPIGPQGLQGPKGDKGESCKIENGFIDCGGYKKLVEELRGPRGFQGDKGDRGEIGAKGDRGDTGPKGDKGERGLKGDTGLTGAQGPKGDKGDSGLTGAQGPRGEKGDRGPEGAKGSFSGCHSNFAESTLASGSSLVVECPVGEIMTGGGCYVLADSDDEVFIRNSMPFPEENFYQCDFYAKGSVSPNTNISASAVCCKI